MDSSKYVEYALKGTEAYYKYLKLTGKAKKNIGIKSIKANENNVELILEKDLFDTENIEFNIRGVKVPVSNEFISVISYDKTNKKLTVRPRGKVAHIFDDMPVSDVVIETDMLFLIKRVYDWYYNMNKEGWRPELPYDKPQVSVVTPRQDSDFYPSNEQMKAIHTALSNPVSYIWGAPGTGKTQFVLAHCILNYIREDKLVFLCAPTNYALDQALKGIIKVLEAEDYSSDLVYRLGTPTPDFVNKYPQSCENIGLVKRLDDIAAQKNTINNILKLRARCQDGEEVVIRTNENILMLKSLSKELSSLDTELEEVNRTIIETEKSLMDIKREISVSQKNIALLKRQAQISGNFINKLFNRDKLSEIQDEMEQAINAASELYTQSDSVTSDLSALESKKSCIDDNISEYNCVIYTLIKCIVKDFSFSSKFKSISSILKETNITEIIEITQEVLNALKTGIDEIHDELSQYLEYKNYSDEDLLTIIDSISSEEQDLLKRNSTEVLMNINILSATADTFFSRLNFFSNLPKKIEHIFIDEAGYLCIAKGMPFFSLSVPVTLLGDHMQIPPICEVDATEFKKPEYAPIVFWSMPIIYCYDLFESTIDELIIKLNTQELNVYSDLPIFSLQTTYRFGSALSNILGHFVYTNGFKSASGDDSTKIIILDAPKEAGKLKRQNISEVKLINSYIKKYNPEDYAVLTPYKNQIILLKESLKTNQNILTVHASQGQEWDTIILSVVDTNDMFFTNSKNIVSSGKYILNTAISRTKKQLVIACDVSFWSNKDDQLICGIIKCADEILIQSDF